MLGKIIALVSSVAIVAVLFIFMLIFRWIEQIWVAIEPSTPIHITARFDYVGKHYTYDTITHTQNSVHGGGGIAHGLALHQFMVPLDDGSGLLILLDRSPFIEYNHSPLDLSLSWIWLDKKTKPSRMIVHSTDKPDEYPEFIKPRNVVIAHIERADISKSKQSETIDSPIMGPFTSIQGPTEGLFFGGLNASLLQGNEKNTLLNLVGWKQQSDGCSILFATGENSKPLTKVSRRFPVTHYGILDHDMSWHIEAAPVKRLESEYIYALGHETMAPDSMLKIFWRPTSYVREIDHAGIKCHLPNSWPADIAISSPNNEWLITLHPSYNWALIPVGKTHE